MKKKLITVMLIVAMSTVSVACGTGTGDEEAVVSGSSNETIVENSDEENESIDKDGSNDVLLSSLPNSIENATVIEEIYNSWEYPETSIEDDSVNKDYTITTTYLDCANNYYFSQKDDGSFINGNPYEPETFENEDVIDTAGDGRWLAGLYSVLSYDWKVVDETDDSIILTYEDESSDMQLDSYISTNAVSITDRRVTATYDKELGCWNHIEIEIDYAATEESAAAGTPDHLYRYELTMTDINNTSVE